MRKIVVGLFMSLDGVTEAPEKWSFPYFTDEIQGHIGASMAASDGLLLGRATYEGFKAAFSNQTTPDANAMNALPKYVASNTLKTADWKNSTLIKGNVIDEITKLKQQPGKDLTMSGSVSLIQSLMKHDLIDEYSLLVYPVVLGTGKRLFAEGSPNTALKLVEAKPFSSGVVLMRYQPDKKA